ncbi:MAG: zinc ABC transporter permease subunit ZnuB [Pseudomonadales bacterium]|nr:zinc ABC transporter permease subunit ZnuB [Pseudomonadales bacterium]
MIELLLPALLGGLGVSLIAGPLGCFVVWRRMAYFGDTLSHSALLGVSLGFLFNINITIAVSFLCVSVALSLVFLQRQRFIASDTLLGILAHSALALGLIVVSLLDTVRINLMAYLFGDLLSIGYSDLIWIYSGGLAVLLLLARYWEPLVSITINEELAQVEGIPTTRMRILLMLMIAVVIAVAMKIVGILLITAMLIIPAATARRLAKTPEQMAALASIFGCISVVIGILSSALLDTPVGPSVVVGSAMLFLLSNLFFGIIRLWQS